MLFGFYSIVGVVECSLYTCSVDYNSMELNETYCKVIEVYSGQVTELNELISYLVDIKVGLGHFRSKETEGRNNFVNDVRNELNSISDDLDDVRPVFIELDREMVALLDLCECGKTFWCLCVNNILGSKLGQKDCLSWNKFCQLEFIRKVIQDLSVLLHQIQADLISVKQNINEL